MGCSVMCTRSLAGQESNRDSLLGGIWTHLTNVKIKNVFDQKDEKETRL